MQRIVVNALLILGASVSYAQSSFPAGAPLSEGAHSSIGYDTVQEALAALKAKPGVRIGEQQGWVFIEDGESDNASSLWSFSPASYRAYPAAVKRTAFEKDGAVYIEMQVLRQAEKRAV